MSYILQCPQPVVGLYLDHAGPVLNKGVVPYLVQGVITIAGNFPCLPLSSSLVSVQTPIRFTRAFWKNRPMNHKFIDSA